MNHLLKAAAFVVCFALLGSAQTRAISNVQFKDMTGKSYDLYQVLGTGKYVYIEMIFNT